METQDRPTPEALIYGPRSVHRGAPERQNPSEGPSTASPPKCTLQSECELFVGTWHLHRDHTETLIALLHDERGTSTIAEDLYEALAGKAGTTTKTHTAEALTKSGPFVLELRSPKEGKRQYGLDPGPLYTVSELLRKYPNDPRRAALFHEIAASFATQDAGYDRFTNESWTLSPAGTKDFVLLLREYVASGTEAYHVAAKKLLTQTEEEVGPPEELAYRFFTHRSGPGLWTLREVPTYKPLLRDAVRRLKSHTELGAAVTRFERGLAR